MTPEGVRISHLPVTLQNVYVTLFFNLFFNRNTARIHSNVTNLHILE